MRKKKELPRKRRRWVKKIIIVVLIILVLAVIAGGAMFYLYEVKMQKSFPITSMVTKPIISVQPDKIYTELQSDLPKYQIEYTSITKQGDSYIVALQDDGKVTFSSQKAIMTQIASLQYILSHLTMEGRQFSSLDLRFDQPVIVFKP